MKIKSLHKLSITTFLPICLCSCLGGNMYGNNSGYSNGAYGNNAYGNNGYGNNPYANNGGYQSNNGAYGNNGMGGGAFGGGVQEAILLAIIQSMAGGVLNGQLASQLTPVDKNFRLHQLAKSLQSGSITQAQQWTNPQTGLSMSLNPIGQPSLNQQTHQQCQTLEEVSNTKEGSQLREERVACLNPQTNKWNLVK